MKKLKKFLSCIDGQAAAVAAVMLVIGVLFIAFPEGSLKIVCYITGSVTLLWGAARFILCFKRGTDRKIYDIVLSVVIIAAGILLLLAPDFIAGIVTVLFGAILIVDSLLKIQDSYDLYKFKSKGWWLGAVIGGACAVLGIIIVFNPFATTRILMIFAGISLIFDAACSFAAVIYLGCKEYREEERGDAERGDGGNVTDI